MNGAPLKIVVIGGVACGPKAAARARRRDPEAEITIIEKGKYISYAGCGLPYYMAGTIPEITGLMTTSSGAVRNPEFFRKVKGIRVLINTVVESVDRNKKEVRIRDIAANKVDVLPYDKLVIATGGAPSMPTLEGINLKKVFALRKPEDAEIIRNTIEAGEADRMCIIGAGRIGLEVADALGAQAVDTTIVEIADQVLPTSLDPEMADYLAQVLRNEKVNLVLGESVVRLEGDENGVVKKVITDQKEIETDAVLIGVGVRPDVALAREMNLQIGPTGAISVDDHMRTSDPDIFAGGDCVECINMITGRRVYNPLGSVANRQGRVIGNNITGGDDIFPGILGTSVVKTLGTNVAKTGLTATEAHGHGLRVVTSLNPSGDRSHFFPGGKQVLLKLVADAETRRVLGAQAVGAGDVVRQIDTIAAAITFGATVDNLAKLDLAYAPPFATAISNVAHSANIIRNKIDGLVEAISPRMLKEKIQQGGDFVLLDVRSRLEVEKSPVKAFEVLHIPQEELQSRINELPKDKEIIVGCQIGLRSYDTLRAALIGAGCSNVKFLDGGWHVWFGCGYDD